LEYVLKDGILYYKDTDIQVILEKEHLDSGENCGGNSQGFGSLWKAADVGHIG